MSVSDDNGHSFRNKHGWQLTQHLLSYSPFISPHLHTTQWQEFRGGPAGVIWGYLTVWVGTLSTGIETPTRMFEYHPLDFLREIGCMTFAGWQAVTASAAYLVGTLLQGVIIMAKPEYIPEPWQSMLFFWDILNVAAFITTIASKTLRHFEGLIFVPHIAGFWRPHPLTLHWPTGQPIHLHNICQLRTMVHPRPVIHGRPTHLLVVTCWSALLWLIGQALCSLH